MFLLGNQQHTLDDKNRVRLPAKFREELGNKYILTPGTGGCIFVYRADETEKLLATLGSLESLSPEREEWIRSIVSEGAAVEADSQGRFLLPQNLKEIAGIDRNVQIVGSISKAEIWSEERWNARKANTDRTPQGFDELYRKLHKEQDRQ